MLAIWRVHGVDAALREAWEAGVVLCGGSAGSLCWFECGTTDSYDKNQLHPLRDGLGLLPYSHCPHYNAEDQRRPVSSPRASRPATPSTTAPPSTSSAHSRTVRSAAGKAPTPIEWNCRTAR